MTETNARGLSSNKELLTLQTSVWFNHLIDRSKALCEAIYYTPAAQRMCCGKLLTRLINDLFRAVTLHPDFTVFGNTPPAFQPRHLLSWMPILLDSTDSFGVLTSTVALRDPENLLQMLQRNPQSKGAPAFACSAAEERCCPVCGRRAISQAEQRDRPTLLSAIPSPDNF